MSAAIRVLLALLPLFLTPALGFLLAGGYLNLGGGEKDIILVLPWAFCSLVYGVSCFFLWYRGWPLRRATFASIIVTIVALLFAGLALILFGQLGVLGLF
jgi:hypothetical protein